MVLKKLYIPFSLLFMRSVLLTCSVYTASMSALDKFLPCKLAYDKFEYKLSANINAIRYR